MTSIYDIMSGDIEKNNVKYSRIYASPSQNKSFYICTIINNDMTNRTIMHPDLDQFKVEVEVAITAIHGQNYKVIKSEPSTKKEYEIKFDKWYEEHFGDQQ